MLYKQNFVLENIYYDVVIFYAYDPFLMCYACSMKKKSHQPSKRILFELFLFVGILAFAIPFCNNCFSQHSDEQVVVKNDTPEPQITDSTSRILFAGTTFWGRNINGVARASELGVDYPFAELGGLEREKYQAWIGNLECPITENDHTKYEEDELFVFNCHTDYLENVGKYWTAFSLGTNHIDNWGDEGIVTTKQNLDSIGVQYFGHYRYDNSTENCGIISLPAIIEYDNGIKYGYKMPLGFCSAHGVFGIPTEEALLNIQRFSEAIPTIVMPHMGVEYENSADDLRTWLFHKMIDYGADMVLADHPHHVQNSEAYNGHLIMYSMGNFMFDQLFDETIYSAAIDTTAHFAADTDFDAWEEIALKCEEKHGDCIDDITNSGLPRLNITWSDYDYVATTNANTRQTRLASDSERAWVGNRLDWANTLSGLKQKQSTPAQSKNF